MVSAVSSNNLLAPNPAQSARSSALEASTNIQNQVQAAIAKAGADSTVSVQYQYSVAPDGSLVVSAATVTTSRRENDQGEAVRFLEPKILKPGDDDSGTLDAPSSNESKGVGPAFILDVGNNDGKEDEGLGAEEYALLRRLAQTDAAVRRHEGLHHRAAGGNVTGPANYGTVEGPDGQFYAVEGDVGVQTTPTTDSDKAERDAETLKLAATAPGDASAQDLAAAKNIGNKAYTGDVPEPGPKGLLDLIA